MTFLVAVISVQLLAPRICEHFDSTLTRRRLAPSVSTPKALRPSPPTKVVTPRQPARHLDADTCDALARATRSGLTASQATEAVMGASIATLEEGPLLDPLLGAALIDGNFDPSALELVAATIRDRTSCEQDARVAVAQASLSARWLTVVPVIGSVMLGAFSSQFRRLAFTPSMRAIIVVGLALNWIGRRWMTSLIAKANRNDAHSITSVVDHLCVSLRAGHVLSRACARLGTTGECGRSIRSNLDNGEPLDRALLPLVNHFGSDGQRLVDLLVTAHRDGQPVLSMVDRLAAETRATRRRDTDTRIRQLPGKMAAPLVLCVLPSFMLLSVAPLVLINIERLTYSLPPAQP